jgi:hypothetical protein
MTQTNHSTSPAQTPESAWIGPTILTGGDQDRFLPDDSEAFSELASGAVSAHREQNFIVNINKCRHLGGLTPVRSPVGGRTEKVRFGGARRDDLMC